MFAGDVDIRHRFSDCGIDNVFKAYHRNYVIPLLMKRKAVILNPKKYKC